MYIPSNVGAGVPIRSTLSIIRRVSAAVAMEVALSSRNIIAAREPGLNVVVGWDNPMRTFFAQVDRQQEDDDPGDPIILWLGSSPGEVLRPEDLVAPLAQHAELTDANLEKLRADRAIDLDCGPTQLQQAMLSHARRP
jgi:hypothetical protein